MNPQYKQTLKRLAKDGATYENWMQYKALADMSAEAYPKTEVLDHIQRAFYKLARLSEITPEQIQEGFRLDQSSVSTPEPFTWCFDSASQKWMWKHD